MRALSIMIIAAAGCGEGEAATCVELPSECTPQYEPTFENIHARTLAATCSAAGGACHASEGAQGGLVTETIDFAYRGLVDDGRVVPGDAECSPLMERLFASDPSQQMPPGAPLADAERCAIARWIDAGAKR